MTSIARIFSFLSLYLLALPLCAQDDDLDAIFDDGSTMSDFHIESDLATIGTGAIYAKLRYTGFDYFWLSGGGGFMPFPAHLDLTRFTWGNDEVLDQTKTSPGFYLEGGFTFDYLSIFAPGDNGFHLGVAFALKRWQYESSSAYRHTITKIAVNPIAIEYEVFPRLGVGFDFGFSIGSDRLKGKSTIIDTKDRFYTFDGGVNLVYTL